MSRDEASERAASPPKARATQQFGHRTTALGGARKLEPLRSEGRLPFDFRTAWSIPRRLIVVWSLTFIALMGASLWWSDAAGQNGYPPSDPYTAVWIEFCLTLLILSVIGSTLFRVIGAQLPLIPPAIAVPAIYAGIFLSQYLIEYRLFGQGAETFVATISSDSSKFQPPPWCVSWTNGRSTCRRSSKDNGVVCTPVAADQASAFYCCDELDLPRWCLSSDDVCGQVWRRSTLPGAPSLYRPVQLSRRSFTPEMERQKLLVERCGLTVFGDVVSK